MNLVAARAPVYRVASNPMDRLRAIAELFDDPSDLDELFSLVALTDDVTRDALGEIKLLPDADRYRGPHPLSVMWPFAMWPFALRSRSRFSDGTFGVWYAGDEPRTAMREKMYHLARWLPRSQCPAQDVRQVLVQVKISDALHDVRRGQPDIDDGIYHPDDYAAANRFAKTARASGAHGLPYSSVRCPGNSCVAVFRPRA